MVISSYFGKISLKANTKSFLNYRFLKTQVCKFGNQKTNYKLIIIGLFKINYDLTVLKYGSLTSSSPYFSFACSSLRDNATITSCPTCQSAGVAIGF